MRRSVPLTSRTNPTHVPRSAFTRARATCPIPDQRVPHWLSQVSALGCRSGMARFDTSRPPGRTPRAEIDHVAWLESGIMNQSHLEDVQAGEPAPTPQPVPATRRRRRVWGVVAVILVGILVGAGVITYVAGGINDDGRFSAEPPACAMVEPSIHLLGGNYTPRLTENNNCELLLPPDHPAYIPNPVITISYGVFTPPGGDAPAEASRLLRDTAAKGRPLPGVGDEAYLWADRNVVLRVSNLVVAINVFALASSTEAQVRAFAADLATRLRTT
jgi:hypothetical protein